MSSLKERPYTTADLKDLTKDALSEIIRSQFSKWPTTPVFNPSKIKKDLLIEGIIANGYTMLVETSSVHSHSLSPPGSPQGSIRPESPLVPELRSLELLIEDLRVKPANKFIQSILLSSKGDLETGEWIIDGKELLEALQRSPSSLDGPFKLSYEDPSEPGWKRYFVKMSVSDTLEAASTTPAQLQIAAESRLRISVEDSGPAVDNRKRQRSLSDTENDPQLGASSSMPSSKKRSSQADAQDVAWLRELLLTRPGYQNFQDDHNKKLTNKARVDFWRFAAQFSKDYFNKNSEASGRDGKAVKKVSIEAALSMGATALNEAEKMMNLIDLFGEGGARREQAVVDRVNSDAIEGRELSQFLVDWERSHRN